MNLETVYAQTAAYAETLPSEQASALQRNLGTIAMKLSLGEDVAVDTGSSAQVTFDHVAFEAFIDSADGETQADIEYATDQMRAYSGFRREISAARNIKPGDADYLGGNTDVRVVRVVHGGNAYAVKEGQIDFGIVAAFRLGENIPHVAHLHAVDMELSTAVMDFIPGHTPNSMSLAERQAVPREHIAQLIDTIVQMHQAGLRIDPKPSNFIYDSGTGYGVIDYSAAKSWRHTQTSLANQVMLLRHMIIAFEPDGPQPLPGTPAYAQWNIARQRAQVALLGQFLDVMEAEHPDILKAAATEQQSLNSQGRLSNGMVYDIYHMPEGEEFNAFRSRVVQLHLEGKSIQP